MQLHAKTYYHPLPDTEIRELIRRTRNKRLSQAERIEARNKILLANTGWRINAAMRALRYYPSTQFEIDDLANEALIGEMRAIELFDLKRENKYITYANRWIRQAIAVAFQNRDELIRRPGYIYRLDAQLRRFAANTGQSELECDAIAKLDPHALAFTLASRHTVRSISTSFRDGRYKDSDVFNGAIAMDDSSERISRSEQIGLLHQAIDALDPRSRLVVEMRMSGAALWQVGEELGITTERVRQIEKRAHGAIRVWMMRGEEVIS